MVPAGAVRLEVRAQMPSGAQFAIGVRYGTPFSATTFNNQYGGIVGENPVVVTQQSNPPLRDGAYYIAVLIVTSAAGTGTVTATVTAGAPSISLDSALAFGNVTVGQSRDLSLAVRNTGTATLGVTSIASSNAQFQVMSPAAPFSIAAASQRDVVIRFQPSATGSQSATLTIRSDDPARPTVTVALSGQGTAAAPVPVIRSADGVVNAASFLPGIASGSWVTIRGTNLSSTTRIWTGADFQGNRLPTALDGVSVKVNNRDALVYYISPTQLNVLAPSDGATGTVSVTVTNALGTSAAAQATYLRYAPAFFEFDPRNRIYPAAVHPDGTYVGPPGLFGTAATTAPARQGGRILLFGTGFGPTNPAADPALLLGGAVPLATPNDLRILVGGIPATLEFAGMVSSGLYQFNIVVPDVPDGDQTLVAEIGGQRSQSTLRLAVAGNPPPVAPRISFLSPSSGSPGQTISTFTIYGQDLTDVNAIEFSPASGITVRDIRAAATSVTAQLVIASDAEIGSRSVTVTSPGGRSNALTFTIQAPSQPGLEYFPAAARMMWDYRVDVPSGAALPYKPIFEEPQGILCASVFCGTSNWNAGQYTFRITAGSKTGSTSLGDTWQVTLTSPGGRFYFGSDAWPMEFRVGVRSGAPQLDILAEASSGFFRLARLLARLTPSDLAARQVLTVAGRDYQDVVRTTVTLSRDGTYLGQDYTEEVFLAPGVGIIRAIMRDASGRTLFTQELTQFTAP
ncbi:MAG: choice-of-anchor D domain-containing protein [Acidobacteriota bacterium]